MEGVGGLVISKRYTPSRDMFVLSDDWNWDEGGGIA